MKSRLFLKISTTLLSMFLFPIACLTQGEPTSLPFEEARQMTVFVSIKGSPVVGAPAYGLVRQGTLRLATMS